MPMRDLPKVSNLLHGLPERLLAPLFVGASQYALAANATLFAAGDAGDGCYRIERGLVKVGMTSPTGEERIVSLLGPGAIVGELSMIDGLARSASVCALQDSVLRFVSRQTFLDFTKAHPEMYQELVSILATRLREANEALVAATFLSAKGRVARAFLEIAEHMGADRPEGRIVLNQKVSQADLAALAGVARENVSRAMSDWRKRKLITRAENHYCINDIAALDPKLNLARKAPRFFGAFHGRRTCAATDRQPRSGIDGDPALACESRPDGSHRDYVLSVRHRDSRSSQTSGTGNHRDSSRRKR